MMTIHDIVEAHNQGQDAETARKLGMHSASVRSAVYVLKKIGYPVRDLPRGRPRKVVPAKTRAAKPQNTKFITDVSQWWAERGF